MKTAAWQTCIACVLSILAVPAFTLGAGAAAEPGRADPPPNIGSSSSEASQLLNGMKTEALQVNDEADMLQSNYFRDLSWQSNAMTIDRMADQVNKMDSMLNRLQSMGDDVNPTQSQVIAQVSPQVSTLTDELNETIHFLNNNHEYLWSPTWHEHMANLFRTSSTLKQHLKSVSKQ